MQIRNANVLVCGAGGFIGGHLVNSLFARGAASVRAVDIKPFDEWYQKNPAADNRILDLQLRSPAWKRPRTSTESSNGGRYGRNGFYREQQGAVHVERAGQHAHAGGGQGSRRQALVLLFVGLRLQRRQAEGIRSGSAEGRRCLSGHAGGRLWLGELFTERMCRHFHEDYGLETRIARFHNVYGPLGTWTGGREKAPAAISRKVLEAKQSGRHEIEIWGDGHQTRSFMYIDDCTKASRTFSKAISLSPSTWVRASW